MSDKDDVSAIVKNLIGAPIDGLEKEEESKSPKTKEEVKKEMLSDIDKAISALKAVLTDKGFDVQVMGLPDEAFKSHVKKSHNDVRKLVKVITNALEKYEDALPDGRESPDVVMSAFSQITAVGAIKYGVSKETLLAIMGRIYDRAERDINREKDDE